MTADFGNFVDKTDEKRKTKDEMNLALDTCKYLQKKDVWPIDHLQLVQHPYDHIVRKDFL